MRAMPSFVFAFMFLRQRLETASRMDATAVTAGKGGSYYGHALVDWGLGVTRGIGHNRAALKSLEASRGGG